LFFSQIEVKAQSAIYILTDGSDEGTDKITQQNGNIYINLFVQVVDI
jgi:hypothetical protein